MSFAAFPACANIPLTTAIAQRAKSRPRSCVAGPIQCYNNREGLHAKQHAVAHPRLQTQEETAKVAALRRLDDRRQQRASAIAGGRPQETVPEDSAKAQTTEVLFACLGDVCRSPAAHAIFQAILEEHGQAGGFTLSNRSTGGGNPYWYKKEGYCFQQGEGCDERMVEACGKRGISVSSTSRVLTPKDVNRCDYIVAMDKKARRDIEKAVKEWAQDPDNRIEVEAAMSKVVLMASFCQDQKYCEMTDVPDPYYGGPQVFELALDVLEDACAGLLAHLCGIDPTEDDDLEACHLVADVDQQLQCHNMMHQCC